MRGRGRNYSRFHHAADVVLGALYVGDWPARLWKRVPGSTKVALRERRIRAPLWTGATLRIGFISDIHVGPTTPIELLENAFGLLDDARVDLLLLGGDYVFLDSVPKKLRILERLVRSVRAPVKLGVFGNHDLWTDDAPIRRALEFADVRMLENEVAQVGALTVVGLADPLTGVPDASVFSALPASEATIVLCHAPDGLLFVPPGTEVHQFVCGHTHGGHIALPGPRPLIVPGPLGKKYPFGDHGHEGIPLYVSRGVGGVEVSARWNAWPEVVVFELSSAE